MNQEANVYPPRHPYPDAPQSDPLSRAKTLLVQLLAALASGDQGARARACDKAAAFLNER